MSDLCKLCEAGIHAHHVQVLDSVTMQYTEGDCKETWAANQIQCQCTWSPTGSIVSPYHHLNQCCHTLLSALNGIHDGEVDCVQCGNIWYYLRIRIGWVLLATAETRS